MDIGNFYCGDRVSAMAEGTVTRMIDPNGALGVRVSHPNGYKTEVWHLSRYKAVNGSHVERGTLLGYVGSTGLDIGGCHVHVACYDPSGKPVDPYPLIDKPNG
jgi:murein DD-endopeptidase MepM/ murein hydrolase activator NlpD